MKLSNLLPRLRRGDVASRSWLRVGLVVLLPLAVVGLVVAAFASQGEATGGRVPAMIVNEDQLIEQVNDDGETEYVLAGRLLVTELTGENGGLDWSLANRAQADAALRDGSAQVVVVIPEDFSDAVLSLGSETPRQANIRILTDDSHGYLSGTVIDALSDSMTALFGRELTEQYIVGVLGGLEQVGTALQTAADGATELARGASGAAAGADRFAGGVRDYTGGVSSLSSGLKQLRSGTTGLGAAAPLLDGYADSTRGVLQLLQAHSANHIDDATLIAQLGALQPQLQGLDAAGYSAVKGLADGLPGIESGIRGAASGAARLAGGGKELRSGASGLAGGLDQLSSGATRLAAGLRSGSDQVPSYTAEELETAASTAANPVTATVDREYPLGSLGEALLAFLLPFALWLGMLAWFTVRRPVGQRQLAGSASSLRLLWHGLRPALAVGLGQAAALVLVMQLVVGASWAGFPALLLVAALAAAAFAAAHLLLTLLFGRAGLVVSLLLAVIQLTATGGLLPIQFVAEPFQVVSALVPISHAVTAAQAVLAGAPLGQWLPPLFVLAGMAIVAAAVALFVLARRRGAVATGLMPREWLPRRLPPTRSQLA